MEDTLEIFEIKKNNNNKKTVPDGATVQHVAAIYANVMHIKRMILFLLQLDEPFGIPQLPQRALREKVCYRNCKNAAVTMRDFLQLKK